SYRFEEYVLWLEADLYDQLQLIQIADTLRVLGIGADQISLICIGEFPGIERFKGLSQLSPRNFAQLYEKRQRMTEKKVDRACKAWRIFSGTDPTQLLTLGEIDQENLPFLAAAFHRLAQEYPSTTNGLSLTQQRILEIVAAAPMSPDRIFQLVS